MQIVQSAIAKQQYSSRKYCGLHVRGRCLSCVLQRRIMASKRAILCSLFILHHIQIDNCIARDVPNAEDPRNDQQYNISTAYLITSSDVTIRVGMQLKLNCTVAGKQISSKYQLSWYHGTQRLTNITVALSNGTIQLIIHRVSWDNNGTYVCKETAYNDVRPKHVMVTVGDIPSAPQAVWTNNLEFRTRIHWTAPSHSGGLPLIYAVKGQCKNTSYPGLPECESEFFNLCESSPILSVPESDSFFCKVSYPLHQDVVTYNAFVEAMNALGSSRSNPVEFKANLNHVVLTTPQPAVLFAAEEVTPAGTVKLTWDDANWQGRQMSVQYTILYHRDGDSHNKSLIVCPPLINTLIRGLSGSSLYYFFLLVQYGEMWDKCNTTMHGTYSDAVVCTVKTSVSAPNRPPTILNCTQWGHLSNSSGLIVTWEIPSAMYLNGPLNNTIINYGCQRRSHKIAGKVTVTNITARRVVIPAILPSDKCHVWMKICNGPQLCSAISNTCVVSGSRSQDNPPSYSKGNILATVVISVAGGLGGLALIIVLVVCVKARRENGERRPQLAAVLQAMLPVVHGYDEIEEPLVDNNYDVITV